MSTHTSIKVRAVTLRYRSIKAIGFLALALAVSYSAVMTKNSGVLVAPLAAIDHKPTLAHEQTASIVPASLRNVFDHNAAPSAAPAPSMQGAEILVERVEDIDETDMRIRYFDGRPCRPVKILWMTVTAYSPDHRSCGKWADGYTASMKSVWTNAMKLVAADRKVLPIGSIISVPGYSNDEIVPVLDVGGAIKGARLDVLYPSHSIALQWGVQTLPVTVWEYIDES